MTARLEFIIGRAGTGKSRACLEDICERLQESPLGASLILLCPEHETYKAERELAAMTPRGGFMRAYVFGFRRFARQVLLETGGERLPRISEVGRRLLLRKLLSQHVRDKDLSVFARLARQRGFTESLSEIIKEMKDYQLSPEVLRAAADSQPASGRLAGKLRELALLAEEFGQALEGRANDAEDLMAELAQKLPEAPLLQGAEVWLDGFTFFNLQELAVLVALLETVAVVHVALPVEAKQLRGGQVELDLPENTLQTGLFHRPCKTMQQVEQLWQELLGVKKQAEKRVLFHNHRAQKTALAAVEKGLYARQAEALEESEGLRLVEAANRRLEVECVAADILRQARQGWRYSEMGVLLRDQEGYMGLMEQIFADYGIPYFSDTKRSSIHHPLAELIRSSLESLRKNWPYEAMIRCLRTSLFPCVREEVDKLENYVLEFGVRGRKAWTGTEPWSWYRSYSLTETGEVSETVKARLLEIDTLRRRVAEPLQKLEQSLRAAENVRSQTQALYEFLVDLGVPEHLQEMKLLAEKEGRLADAGEHEQIWDSCMALFDQLVEISGDEQMKLADYEKVLADGLDALQISLIPPGLDYVAIGYLDQHSLANIRGLYILGANAGLMPRRQHSSGLLTDADRTHLADALHSLRAQGKDIQGYISRGGQERSFAEKYTLYNAFNAAREYLWLSWALADSEGGGLQPSGLILHLRKLFPKLKVDSIPLETLEREDEWVLSAPGPALSGLANALRGQREGGRMPAFWKDVYNWALAQKNYKEPLGLALQGLFAAGGEEKLPEELAREIYLQGRSLRGSVTRFEEFSQCPFKHFAHYGLKLQERPEYAFRLPDLGILLHEVLCAYGERVKKDYGNEWNAVPEERRETLCKELVDELAPRLHSKVLLSRGSYRFLIRRLWKTAWRSVRHLTAWSAISRYRPAFFEEHFGSRNDNVHIKPLPLRAGFSLSFRGQIDRVDVQADRPYYLVLDYKTGEAAINLFEVYYGLKLQLLVYVLVAREIFKQQGKERLPAGMLYAFLKNPVISSESRLADGKLEEKVRKALCLPGWVMADAEVIEALQGEGGGFIEPDLEKYKKFTEGRTNSRAKFLTLEKFDMLLSYVDYILTETGNRILSGEIAAVPYRTKDKNACEHCNFNDVCGFDPQIRGYAYRDLKDQDDSVWEAEMEKVMQREETADGTGKD